MDNMVFLLKKKIATAWTTITRWLQNGSQRKYEWQFSPYYWKFVGRWQSIKFAFGKSLFAIRGWNQSRLGELTIFLEILKTIGEQILLAIVSVVGLTVLDAFLAPNITPLSSVNQETFVISFLSVVAQVGGVFLGLYFTAVSVVASTVYARVPGDIREVLTREKVGNLYIRIVALTVAVAILLLAKGALGFSIGVPDLFFIALLAVFAILSFVPLGMRIFYFFDPSKLAQYLGHELVRWFRASTPKGFQWHNSSFQAHYQKQAEHVLLTYSNIVSLAVNEERFDAEALVRLIQQPLLLLQLYCKQKASIPSDSYWFKRTYRHHDWLTADYTEIGLALRSGTALQPEATPDFMWFERHVEKMVVHAIEALIRRDNLRNAAEILDNVQRTQAALAEHLAIDETLHLFREFWPQVQKIAFGGEYKDDGLAKEDEDGQLVKLSFIDVYCLELVSILLGFSKTLRQTEAKLFTNRIGKIKWHKPESIYLTRVPREVIKQLEYLQNGLEFERAVEGDLISPVWYRNQIAALGMVRIIQRTVEELIKEWENTFSNQTERLVKEKRFLNATQVVQRGLEGCNKFIRHLDSIKACFEQFSTLRRVEDIPWPTPDWDDFAKRVMAIRERLIVSFAKSSTTLAQMPIKENWPDYFGQCFSVLAEECNSAMVAGNEKLFEQIFPFFFSATFAAHQRLRTQLAGRTDQAAIVFMIEPIQDLLHLSGYALIYAELDGKKYWDIVKKLWDSYLDKQPGAKEVLEYILSLLSYRQSVFAIFPRDSIRTSWKQNLERRLRADKIFHDSYDYEFGTEEMKPKHASKIIEVIARGSLGMISSDPHDIFLAIYVGKHPEALGLKLPRGAEDFLYSLERLQRPDMQEEKD